MLNGFVAHPVVQQITKRIKSLIWRTIMMAAAIVLVVLAENLEMFKLSGELTVLLGLILGEVSKYINAQIQEATA